MYYIIGAICTSLILYWILQSRDDEKARREGRPLATMSKRVLLIFFLIVVTTILFFFISNAFKDGTIPVVDLAQKTASGGGANDYKLSMVRNIREDVHVGVPPFGTDTDILDMIDDRV